jgi:4a-hydroxytetrahydrobiopterin dehydratase
MDRLLSDDEVAAALAGLSGWTGTTEAVSRTVEAADFLAAIALVNRVAEAAEAADHHPDIDIRWRTVTFTLSTHSAGGVTGKDMEMARRIDELAAAPAG